MNAISTIHLSERPRPKALRQYPVGTVYLKNRERLDFYAGTYGRYSSGTFVNEAQQVVGFSDILPQERALDYIFVYPQFRQRGYSTAILQATLLGLKHKAFNDQGVAFINGYIRHPFIARTLLRHGFDPSGPFCFLSTQQDPRIEIVLSPLPDADGRIPIFVEDLKWVRILKKFCELPDNPDWAIFKVVDEPLEGDQLMLFDYYSFDRPADLNQQIRSSGNAFAFYL